MHFYRYLDGYAGHLSPFIQPEFDFGHNAPNPSGMWRAPEVQCPDFTFEEKPSTDQAPGWHPVRLVDPAQDWRHRFQPITDAGQPPLYSSVRIILFCFAVSCVLIETVTELTCLWIFALHSYLCGQFAHWSCWKETWNCWLFLSVYPQDFGSYLAGPLPLLSHLRWTQNLQGCHYRHPRKPCRDKADILSAAWLLFSFQP